MADQPQRPIIMLRASQLFIYENGEALGRKLAKTKGTAAALDFANRKFNEGPTQGKRIFWRGAIDAIKAVAAS